MIKTMKFSEVMKQNEVFIDQGKTIFTGGLSDTVYNVFHNFIKEYFANYYIGLDDATRWIKLFQTRLLSIEYIFYSMVKMNINETLVDKTILTPYIEKMFFNSADGRINNSGENEYTGRYTNTANNETTTVNNTVNNGFTRGLNSVTPQSNVEDVTEAPIDTPIKWKYATSMQDGYSKNVGESESMVSSTTNSNSNDTNNSNYTNNTNSREDKRGVEKIYERYREDILNNVLNMLNRTPSLFNYLTNKLQMLFLYKIDEWSV